MWTAWIDSKETPRNLLFGSRNSFNKFNSCYVPEVSQKKWLYHVEFPMEIIVLMLVVSNKEVISILMNFKIKVFVDVNCVK